MAGWLTCRYIINKLTHSATLNSDEKKRKKRKGGGREAKGKEGRKEVEKLIMKGDEREWDGLIQG